MRAFLTKIALWLCVFVVAKAGYSEISSTCKSMKIIAIVLPYLKVICIRVCRKEMAFNITKLAVNVLTCT